MEFLFKSKETLFKNKEDHCTVAVVSVSLGSNNIKHCLMCQAQLELIKSCPSGDIPAFTKMVERHFAALEGTQTSTRTIDP